MGADLVAVADRLVAGAARWEAAYRDWGAAVEARARVAARADRWVLEATGGRSVARFEAVCARRSVRSVADARQKASAIRARPAVTAAISERERALAAAAEAVAAARVVLSEASEVLLGYGAVGPGLVGRSCSELRRLARRGGRPGPTD